MGMTFWTMVWTTRPPLLMQHAPPADAELCLRLANPWPFALLLGVCILALTFLLTCMQLSRSVLWLVPWFPLHKKGLHRLLMSRISWFNSIRMVSLGAASSSHVCSYRMYKLSYLCWINLSSWTLALLYASERHTYIQVEKVNNVLKKNLSPVNLRS